MRVLSILVVTVISCGLAYPSYPDESDRRLDLMSRDVTYELVEDSSWPDETVKFGQVSGLEAGLDNKVYVFHRADRPWNTQIFFDNNTFMDIEAGPIKMKTISILDANTGKQISAMGEDRFYMPHGLTVDGNGNIWVTDVALHQVMRFPKGSKEPDMIVGKKLEPGNDATHFCKPTDVAVASNGDFFVTDGYCNSRVMKFHANGTMAKEWGTPVSESQSELTDMNLRLPHSVTVVEKYDMVCVADREDRRVQCYNAGLQEPSKTGEFIYTLLDDVHAFAVDYDETAEVIYVAIRPHRVGDPRGATVGLDGTVLEKWWPIHKKRSLPHDVSVSPDGSTVYLADVNGYRAVKFERVPGVFSQ